MRKIGFFLIIIILIVLLIPKEKKEFRIRVIANSNSIQDQNIKMKVVNALLLEIRKYDEEKVEIEINKNYEKIEKIVKNILVNTDYSIAIKKTRFPPKEYKDEIIKGGKYKSLVIIIGEGEGKNWWSLLNPDYPFGFEDIDSDDVIFKFYFLDWIKN